MWIIQQWRGSGKRLLPQRRLRISFLIEGEVRTHRPAADGKNESGRSREVRRPALAARIAGMVLTTTAAVATSPCVPPGIVRVRCGSPFRTTVSAGCLAPTYIFKLHKNFFLAGRALPRRDLMHAGHLARSDFQKFRLEWILRRSPVRSFRKYHPARSPGRRPPWR